MSPSVLVRLLNDMVYFDRILLTYANLQFGFKKADYFSNYVKSFFVVFFLRIYLEFGPTI